MADYNENSPLSDTELNLTNSLLILDGDEEERKKFSDKIDNCSDYLKKDKEERKKVYTRRRDFYQGNHGKYTNITGLQNKEKQGHANAVINYAGKTVQKIAQGMSNNPPSVTFPIDELYKPEESEYEVEETRTQAVEDFVGTVLKRNKFYKRSYRRACFNQSEIGDYAIKVYPVNIGTKDKPSWDIRVVNQEKMEHLLVGWRGDDAKEFDFVIVEEMRSVQSIEEEWGVKIPKADIVFNGQNNPNSQASSHNSNQYATKTSMRTGQADLPSGEILVPSVLVQEYDDLNVYAIKIAGKLAQYVKKDGKTFPKMKFWVLGENIPNPGSHWSIADIDQLIDVNIELNEASNEERDYIRVGANQKYVAYNMSDFDPESIKTGSGGVIFVESTDDRSRFEPLQTNVNTYPADVYINRIKKHIHDMGIPEVTYGASPSSSGRSKALDYQSMIDLITFKHDSWELTIDEVSEKIQTLGYFYFRHDFFTDAKTGQFKARSPEFDWSDILPVTQGDKIVNVLNKVQIGLPYKLAFKELGYKDVDAVVNMMKKEANDPELMLFRAKMYQLTSGVMQAQAQAQAMSQQGIGEETGGMDVNAQNASPTLTSSQNEGRESRLPVSAKGGTTSYSTSQGMIDQARQNLTAQGK